MRKLRRFAVSLALLALGNHGLTKLLEWIEDVPTEENP